MLIIVRILRFGRYAALLLAYDKVGGLDPQLKHWMQNDDGAGYNGTWPRNEQVSRFIFWSLCWADRCGICVVLWKLLISLPPSPMSIISPYLVWTNSTHIATQLILGIYVLPAQATILPHHLRAASDRPRAHLSLTSIRTYL